MSPADGKPPRVHFENVSPIIRVRDLQASVDYYLTALGFTLDWHNRGVMASVSRDGCGVMLCEGHQGCPGTWVWFGVSDAQALFEEVSAKGAIIRLPPTNFPWAYEMQAEDPDGHVLRFGSDPKDGRPFADWVD